MTTFLEDYTKQDTIFCRKCSCFAPLRGSNVIWSHDLYDIGKIFLSFSFQIQYMASIYWTHFLQSFFLFLSFWYFRLTFARVIRKRSTGGFSCLPYILALFNCLVYTLYGSPVVSKGWENFPLVTINGVGILLEISFILIYFWFSEAKGKASLFYCHSTHDNYYPT